MKKLPWILLGLVGAGALYVSYLLLSAASALENARSEASRQRARSDVVVAVVAKEWVGRDAAGVAALTREMEAVGVTVGTEGEDLEIGDLIFEVQQGVVAHVRYID